MPPVHPDRATSSARPPSAHRSGYFARGGPIARSEDRSTCLGVTLDALCSASSANRSHVRAMSIRMD